MAEVARHVGEHDTRLWRVLHHYVDEARARDDHSTVSRAAFDETSARRGHDYVSLFVDLDGPRVLFVANGKDAATVGAFADDLKAHGGDPARIEEVCMDMSAAFIAGAAAHLPQAEITFDRFHIVKIINEGVDEVRREEQKSRPELKQSRYVWLKNETNLSSGHSPVHSRRDGNSKRFQCPRQTASPPEPGKRAEQLPTTGRLTTTPLQNRL